MPAPLRQRLSRTAQLVRRLDRRERAVAAAVALRRRLPGDREYGDPLSTAGDGPSQVLGRRLSGLLGEQPSALRELGMGALQVWQALSESRGRGRGDQEVAILFVDLVGFSSWALEAGDDAAVRLLRGVGRAVEPAVAAHGGRVVKRLGDGLMAVFPHPWAAVAAAREAIAAVPAAAVDGYAPHLRAGVHVGRPRELGGDLFGVDVNIAARIADAAGADEVLVSEDVCAALAGAGDVTLRRRWRFRAKGAPKGLRVFAVEAG